MPGRHALAMEALDLPLPPSQALREHGAFKIAGATAYIAGWFTEGDGLSRYGHAAVVPHLFQQV
jgi:hypothetical protein